MINVESTLKKTFLIIIFLSNTYIKLIAQKEDLPTDKKATKETINLYHNLKRVAKKGFLIGHQDDLAYGVNWRYEPGRSDIKDVCGDYPALYGWDICGLENNDEKNIDGVPFTNMKKYIEEGYARGGVITIDWHFKSPLDAPKGAWDVTPGTVASILPGGANNKKFKTWLDHGAAFLSSLKGKNGEVIPILFRPFHELSGNWFWWGTASCSVQEFNELWKFTIDYLVNKKGLHNLLLVFNTGTDFTTPEKYLERYPGDDLVDVLSFDNYQNGQPSQSEKFITATNKALDVIEKLGAEKSKPIALAEMGYEQVPDSTWWTGTFSKAVANHHFSYALFWRNHGWNADMNPPHMHYYAPYIGQVSAGNFVKFYNSDKTFFERDAKKEKMYSNN